MLNPWRHQAVVEAARRRNRESTYTHPLGLDAATDDRDLKALQAFLKEFYPTFYSREATAARTKKLEEFPEVAMFHKALVPKVVSIEEFWQRYEYRCDESRIMSEWDRHPARGRQVMGEAMSSWFNSKTTWLDSQVESVKTIVTEATASAATTPKTRLPTIDSEETIEFNGEDNSPPTPGMDRNKQARQPLKESSRNNKNSNNQNNRRQVEEQSKKQPYVPPHKRREEPPNKKQPYVPPHKRKEEPQKQAYVPPHRRGQASTGKVKQPTTNSQDSKPKQEETTKATNQTTSSPAGTKQEEARPTETSSKSDLVGSVTKAERTLRNKWILSLLLCLVMAALLPFIPRLLGIELVSLCTSSTLAMDKSWVQTLLCTSSTGIAVEPISFDHRKKTNHNKKKQKTHKPKPDKKRNNNMNRPSGGPSSAAAAANIHFDSNHDYRGGGGTGPLMNDQGEDSSTGSLVQSLISSWMQNTDLEQLTRSSSSADMAQIENAYTTTTMESSQNNNNDKKKRGGLIGFFQRRFGRKKRNDDQSHALTMPSSSQQLLQQQPQMVIHQHIHHVVHHVVHEVQQS